MTAGYICTLIIALIFMLYMDGSIGVMMLSFLILMPVISIIMTLIARRNLKITLELPDSAAKHQQVSAVIKLEKTTPLPLPFLRMNLHADAHFDVLNPEADPLPPKPMEEGNSRGQYQRKYKYWKKLRRTQLLPDTLPLCLSMGTAKTAEYRIRLHTRFCGSGEVSLHEIRISDYFAMFRMKIKTEVQEQLLITPEIPDLKANSALFRSVSTAVAASDEETDATPTHSASSMPGYEHRDYIPGDSLKRINWKLSSKRRHLMVRQDEPIALARLSVVLDFRRDHREIPLEQRLDSEEQLIETALGFLMLCARYGYPCKLCYPDAAGEWTSFSIDDGEQLAVEAVNLLRGGFRSAESLAALPALPPALMQESGSVLLYFSADAGAETAAGLESYPALLYLVVPEQEAEHSAVPKNGSLWLVTPDRSLVQAGGEA